MQVKEQAMPLERKRAPRALALLSGGLDSQLAVCVLRDAGVEVEGVTFETPFFNADAARRAAAALGVKHHVVDFTLDEISLLKNPPHGFGGAMNPCIDCHALMIKRAGELMERLGFDFIATGEVLNQRPMSQNRRSLDTVAKDCGLEGRLVRPLSAGLLEPTLPETEGLLNRSKLLSISGRCRKEQLALAAKYSLHDYPSPAGGCKLTEKGYGNRLRDLMEHEGLDDLRMVRLLQTGRRFRLAGGSGLVLGRDEKENAVLLEIASQAGFSFEAAGVSGPVGFIYGKDASESDMRTASEIVVAWGRGGVGNDSVSVEIRKCGHASGNMEISCPLDRNLYESLRIL